MQKLSEVSFSTESKPAHAKAGKAHVPNPRFLAAMRTKAAKESKAVVLGVGKQQRITTQLEHDHATDNHWGITTGDADGDKTEARVLAKELYQVIPHSIKACYTCVQSDAFATRQHIHIYTFMYLHGKPAYSGSAFT
jgi:hypothetical protein